MSFEVKTLVFSLSVASIRAAEDREERSLVNSFPFNARFGQ